MFLVNHYRFLVAAAFVVVSTLACAQSGDRSIEARIRRVENGLLPARSAEGADAPAMCIDDRMADLKIPGLSIAVINRGVIEWARGYGMADVATGGPVTVHTLFQAASLSKPVTAMAALSLVQAGVLSLDLDVNRDLVSWRVPSNDFTERRKVTLRALLSHTAGVGVEGYTGYRRSAAMPTLRALLDGKAPAHSDRAGGAMIFLSDSLKSSRALVGNRRLQKPTWCGGDNCLASRLLKRNNRLGALVA